MIPDEENFFDESSYPNNTQNLNQRLFKGNSDEQRDKVRGQLVIQLNQLILVFLLNQYTTDPEKKEMFLDILKEFYESVRQGVSQQVDIAEKFQENNPFIATLLQTLSGTDGNLEATEAIYYQELDNLINFIKQIIGADDE